MALYDHYCLISCGGITIGPTYPMLRARFTISHRTIDEPSLLELRVSNTAPTTDSAVTKEWQSITIDAGYQSQHGTIFSGQVKFFKKGRESPTDTYLDISAQDSDKAYNFAIVNTELPAGSTPKDIVNAAVQAMQSIDQNIMLGTVTVDLSMPKYSQPIRLYAEARKILTGVAYLKSATWNIYQGQIQITQAAAPSSTTGAVILNSNTGLIGRAIQIPEKGILARSLINNQIVPNGLVSINQSSIDQAGAALSGYGLEGADPNTVAALRAQGVPSIAADGLYKVLAIDYTGDTWGTPWYMDIICLNVGSGINSADQAAAALVSPDFYQNNSNAPLWLPGQGAD